jgi:hypothetical protein
MRDLVNRDNPASPPRRIVGRQSISGPWCNGSMFKKAILLRIQTANIFYISTIRKRSRFESWGLHQLKRSNKLDSSLLICKITHFKFMRIKIMNHNVAYFGTKHRKMDQSSVLCNSIVDLHKIIY